MSAASTGNAAAETRAMNAEREIYAIVGICRVIAKNNPRANTSPLNKHVTTFSKCLTQMTQEEVLDMAKAFYMNHFADAENEANDWLTTSAALIFGDEDDKNAIRLNLHWYATVAKQDLKGTEYDTLRYHALRLIQHMATRALAANLEVLLAPLHQKLGKPITGEAAGTGAGNSFLSGIGDMLSGAFKQLLDPNSQASISNMIANPNGANMLRNLTNGLDPAMREELKPLIEDLQKGQFDFSKVVERVSTRLATATAAEGAAAAGTDVQAVRHTPALEEDDGPADQPLSTSNVIIPALPASLEACGTCGDGSDACAVCFASDYPADDDA